MLATVVLVVVLGYFVYRALARPSNFPPGPVGLPVVGYLPFLEKDVHKHMTKLSDQYGDVYGLTFGSYRVVVLNSLTTIRDAFKEDAFSGRPDFPFFLLRTDNKKGVIFSDGQNWQIIRRFTLRNLRDFGLGKSSIEGLVHYEIEQLIKTLSSMDGAPMNLANRFNLAVVNALWTMTAGARFSHDDPAAVASIESINEAIQSISASNPVEFIPFLSNFGPWKNVIEHRFKFLEPMFKLVADAIGKHNAAHKAGDESDLIHTFIERINNNDDSNPSFDEENGPLNLKNLLIDLYAAGTETTSTSLLWLVLLLATHPEIQEKAQREIDTHVPRDQLPSMEHRPKLNYTEATIRESMRYATIVPLGVFHSTLEDTEFRGYIIPKGTIIFGNAYKIHHDPEHWEKPDEFYPEHFLDDDGHLTNPEAFIPFAIGKRACLGESLAKMELFLFAAALLQKFTFKFPADRPRPTLEPNISTISSPKPFDVIVQLRE
nr:CYP370C3 protein [Diaphanosoma celebensis]